MSWIGRQGAADECPGKRGARIAPGQRVYSSFAFQKGSAGTRFSLLITGRSWIFVQGGRGGAIVITSGEGGEVR